MMTGKSKTYEQAFVAPSAPITEAIRVIDKTQLLIALVVDGDNRLLGTVTDGDVRRGVLRSVPLDAPIETVMNRHPRTAQHDTDRDTMLALMQRWDIRQLPLVRDDGSVAGLALQHDLMEAGDPVENRVLLAAGGMGRRLRPLTDETPKPLLKVGGKPILEIILDSFIAQNFRNFTISVNYRAQAIIDYFGDGSAWNVNIDYLREDREMGTAGALSLIEDVPGRPFIVMNADLLTNVDFRNLLEFHREQHAIATMCVKEYDLEVPFGVVNVDGQRIVRIDEKPSHSYLINAGIYVFEPTVLSMLPKNTPCNMPDLFDQIIEARHNTAVFPIREYWLDIGHPEQYRIANGDVEKLFG